MKFSIQEEGKEKQVFFTFKEASQETTIPISDIWRVLKRKTESKKFKRKDGKVFFIQEEMTDEPFFQVDGEDIFDCDELIEKFGISHIVFFNQILKKKNHFLDSEEISNRIRWKSPDFEFFKKLWTLKNHFLDSEDISHRITWKSPDFEFFIDKLRENQRDEKIL